MTPAEVNVDNEDLVRTRVAIQRQPFRKGYLGDWSKDIFQTGTRLPTTPVTYELKDLVGKPIKGRFYEPEFQKVLKSDDERFDVDRVPKIRNVTARYSISCRGRAIRASSTCGSMNSSSNSWKFVRRRRRSEGRNRLLLSSVCRICPPSS